MEGPLEKRSKGGAGSWQKRFFYIVDGILLYADKQGGAIREDKQTVLAGGHVHGDATTREFVFTSSDGSKTCLRSSTAEDAAKWVANIKTITGQGEDNVDWDALRTRAQNALLGAFVGDSACMPTHWWYDINVLDSKFTQRPASAF